MALDDGRVLKIKRDNVREMLEDQAPFAERVAAHEKDLVDRLMREHESNGSVSTGGPDLGRLGEGCPICLEPWNVNIIPPLIVCCCKAVCNSCFVKLTQSKPSDLDRDCPLCRQPDFLADDEEYLVRLQRHVDNDVPVAICHLGTSYAEGCYGLKPSPKKAALLFQRAAELGNAMAMVWLAHAHHRGEGVERDETKAFEYLSSVFFCHSVL